MAHLWPPIPVPVPQKLPQHIAIIMDGNGRWAKERGLPRMEGHRRGAETVRTVLELTGELGIPYLTLYAFSSENWKRPREEVFALMLLLEEYLARQTAELNEKNVRLHAIGRLSELPDGAQASLRKSIAETASNTGTNLILALNSGGREEIVDSQNRLVGEGEGES